MSAWEIAVDVLLGMAAMACWVGVLGMIRMRDAYQALHYLGPPAIVGVGALTIAVFVQTGWSLASWKCAIIFIVLVGSNDVVVETTLVALLLAIVVKAFEKGKTTSSDDLRFMRG